MAITPKYRAARLAMAVSGLALLAACGGTPLDVDMRGRLVDGFGTADAARNVPARPEPDSRGVISYPNSQVVVARRGDTVATIAQRLGVGPAELARYNGISADAPLREGEVIALPSRVAESGTTTGGNLQAPGQINVTELASAAIDRAGPGSGTGTASSGTTSAPAAQPAAQPATPAGPEPTRHQVRRGETAYSIGRLYGVPVRAIAEWNGLGPDLAVREGQQLLIPSGGAATPAAAPAQPDPVSEPGQGSPTPLPPSSAQPLPEDDTTEAAAPPETPPAPDIGEPSTPEPASESRLIYPVNGTIIREYSRGRNEGIDISVPAGTPVKAAADGTVAAITSDTDGASIVVVRHSDNLLTVYVNLTDLQVQKDQTVSQGQTLASVPQGDPSYLHFETREGLQSVDPAGFLP